MAEHGLPCAKADIGILLRAPRAGLGKWTPAAGRYWRSSHIAGRVLYEDTGWRDGSMVDRISLSGYGHTIVMGWSGLVGDWIIIRRTGRRTVVRACSRRFSLLAQCSRPVLTETPPCSRRLPPARACPAWPGGSLGLGGVWKSVGWRPTPPGGRSTALGRSATLGDRQRNMLCPVLGEPGQEGADQGVHRPVDPRGIQPTRKAPIANKSSTPAGPHPHCAPHARLHRRCPRQGGRRRAEDRQVRSDHFGRSLQRRPRCSCPMPGTCVILSGNEALQGSPKQRWGTRLGAHAGHSNGPRWQGTPWESNWDKVQSAIIGHVISRMRAFASHHHCPTFVLTVVLPLVQRSRASNRPFRVVIAPRALA
jgi:hypothetical protein